MDQTQLLVIDDERNLARSLEFALRREGIVVTGAASASEGLVRARSLAPDAILLDLRLPDRSGQDVLQELALDFPETPVIMISAHGDTKAAVQAVRAGAVDYLTKPFDIEELLLILRHCLERRKLRAQVRYYQGKSSTSQLIGNAPVIMSLHQQINRIAQSSARRVLVGGDTGTGKGLVARVLHEAWFGPDASFVEVNCAALPSDLVEAELFGAERGAYTGSVERRDGLVRIADSGTLFLDEIGEMDLKLQAKVLTFLESGSYRPIGSARSLTSKARIIAASNRNLLEQVEQGRFREDLYFRLNILPLEIPALADRGEDIWLLAHYFAEQFALSEGCKAVEFSKAVRSAFLNYPWPGNVRELRNIVERLTILYPGRAVDLAHLPPEFAEHGSDPSSDGIRDQLARTELEVITTAIAQAGGRKGIAAEQLGISRHALKRRMQRLGLE
jgi:two-component system, NtrC family, response regulator AtoC